MRDFKRELLLLNEEVVTAICHILTHYEESQRPFNFISTSGRQFNIIKRYHAKSFAFHNIDDHGYMFSYQISTNELIAIYEALEKNIKGTAVVLGDLPDTYSTR